MIVYIINQYATSPEVGTGGRHYYIAKELVKLGHTVFLVTSSFSHLMHSPIEIKEDFGIFNVEGINHIYIKTLRYKTSRDFRRMLNWLIFSWKVSRLFKIVKTKPNIIIVSSPPPISFLGALSLAKKFKSKLIYDVRDIWPLAIVELGGFSTKNPLIKIMQWIEEKAYKHSNTIMSSIPYADEYMETLGVNKRKFFYLPNGFDKKELSNKNNLNISLSSKIPKNKFVVGYVGSLGLANALSIFLDAAELLNNDKSIVFVLTGKGGELHNLKLKVKLLKLKNIIFFDQVPKKHVQSIIQLFDVCYIGWLKKSGYKFGISPQKIPEYLFSGKPIIHSYSGRGCIVKKANAGISVPAENPIAIKNAILTLKKMSKNERVKLGKNGKEYSIRNYDYKIITKKLESIF